MTIDPIITTTTKPRPKQRRRKPATVPTCDQCGDELAVRWRGRWWCITCDEAELFSESKD